MSDRRLRDDLRDYYLSREPSQATLERLKEMEAATRHDFKRSPILTWLSTAATVLISASLWIVLADRETGTVSRAIADEIAMNHNKRLDVEFETASYGELRGVMDRLEFSLAEPGPTSEGPLRLIGARYCSIQGQLAAQLRLEASDGKNVTLYQTALTHDLESFERAQLRSGGLVIDLWQEDGVFLGMARAP